MAVGWGFQMTCWFIVSIGFCSYVSGHRPVGGLLLEPVAKERVVISAAPHMRRSSRNGSSQVARDSMGVPWVHCADEGQHCSCSSGIVRYGQGERWITSQRHANTSHMICSNSAPQFGGIDPAVLRRKQCWCLRSPGQDSTPPAYPTVAIVLLSRRAFDLQTWIHYHLNYMGVTHVFMDVEDTPDFEMTWQKVPKRDRDRITLQRASLPVDIRPLDNYTSLQHRQKTAMMAAKKRCEKSGIEWLIHIDDDELLYIPTHRSIGEYLASVSPEKSQVVLRNAEAVYESAGGAGEHCFTHTSSANVNYRTFQSYANGKAALRVSSPIAWVPISPHFWAVEGETPSYTAGVGHDQTIRPTNPIFGPALFLLHYESCPYTRWKDKFWELGNTSPEKAEFKNIPFTFYKQSLERMRCCGNNQSSNAGQEPLSLESNCSVQRNSKDCCEAGLQDFWARWKTKMNPNFRAKDLMPIVIPWDEIKRL